MLSQQKAQTGARVYMGARMAPNRGQVSQQGANGYIQREMRNKRQSGVITPVGRDNQSDNRSTIAAKALQRKQGYNNGGRTGGMNQTPGTRPGPRPNGQGQLNTPTPPGNTHNPRDPGGPAGPRPGTPAGNTPQSPQLQINDQGLLQLPYNQDFSVQQFQAIGDANEQLLGLKMDADAANIQYAQDKRLAGQEYQTNQTGTLNRNAVGGTAFSSAYGTQTAQNAQAYANKAGALDAQNVGFNQNLSLQRAAIQAALNQQLGLGAQGYANDLNALAGTLGFGNAQQRHPPPNGKNPGNWPLGQPNTPGGQRRSRRRKKR